MVHGYIYGMGTASTGSIKQCVRVRQEVLAAISFKWTDVT